MNKLYINQLLKDNFENVVTEHKFSDKRRFRFDWAIPNLKIAFEYEGIISRKSRHTTLTGYTNDCEKYNLAQIEGWKVFRYTAKNISQIERDIELIKNN